MGEQEVGAGLELGLSETPGSFLGTDFPWTSWHNKLYSIVLNVLCGVFCDSRFHNISTHIFYAHSTRGWLGSVSSFHSGVSCAIVVTEHLKLESSEDFSTHLRYLGWCNPNSWARVGLLSICSLSTGLRLSCNVEVTVQLDLIHCSWLSPCISILSISEHRQSS